MRSRSFIVCGIVLALAALPVAADQTEELARLREEAVQLRQLLNKLEARIQALENQNVDPAIRKESTPVQWAPSTAVVSLQPIVSLKQNWSQVERGIAQEKVQSLLGPPGKVLRIDGNLVWYYAYRGIGRGSVFFNGDGKVSSAQSPSFGW